MHPSHFGLPPPQAITNELNKKYANRVLHDVGLCMCVFDLAEVGEGKVRYGDGFLWYKGVLSVLSKIGAIANAPVVVFRLVVFRPFPSEVILAKVKSSDEDGIRRTSPLFPLASCLLRTDLVTLGFFDDIYVPKIFLPEPSALYASLRFVSGFTPHDAPQ